LDNQHQILSRFHPLIGKWFAKRFEGPTDIQQKAWPHILTGNHVLITAPTGSGKTLTAFLWAIHQLIAGTESTGKTRVLYVSPLKALNNDVQRNLIVPLSELSALFESNGIFFPSIRVLTRSGDTSQAERRQIIRHPPEILITTPESLNLMISSGSGRNLLSHLQTVILDEIHAVIDSRRGVHLITAVDRLVRLSGEFQRIAISATINPLETAAAFVGGYQAPTAGWSALTQPRPVTTIAANDTKTYRINIQFPEMPGRDIKKGSVWEALIPQLKSIIHGNHSTLLFTNSRRLCEKITYLLNRSEEQPLAYAHHGSLSREIRQEVELKLKHGVLKAIVATSSLELGIDIGELDEVILIQSPFSILSTIQKIGRAGHQVDGISHGTIFPTYAFDILQAAVLHASLLGRDIEPLYPVESPLDVLAQIIVSMTGTETWNIDELFGALKTSYPYRNLEQETFHLVLNMLAGRYADSKIRELKPRVSVDWLDRTVSAKKGALLALYMSGGTIPDRGYFSLRHHDTHVRIGELDEEFVWEATIGKTFTLGTQNWKVQRITHNDVFVSPGHPSLLEMPFWKSDEVNRSFHLSARIADFMKVANKEIDHTSFSESIQQLYGMNEPSARILVDFLKEQKKHTQTDLPHRHHLLVEYINRGPGPSPANQVALHTLWGGRLNRPFAMALEAAWEDRFSQKLEVFPGNDCVFLMLPHEIEATELLSLVNGSNFQGLVRKQLEGSGFFSACFRECASRALLITRNRIHERLPLWMSRLKSQKLMDAILPYDDFPILLETWRSCLQDEFDLPGLQLVLDELDAGIISWTDITTSHPSPLAASMSWEQINTYMYQEDRPVAGKSSSLRESLISEIVQSPDLRPALSPTLITQFEEKRQRIYPGYAPQSPRELVDWVKERLLIPEPEWQTLKDAMSRLSDVDVTSLVRDAAEKLAVIRPGPDTDPLVTSVEMLPMLQKVLYGDHQQSNVEALAGIGKSRQFPEAIYTGDIDAGTIIGEWLQFYGPITPDFISQTLGLSFRTLQPHLAEMLEDGRLISGQLVIDSDRIDVCDRENFEILLRLNRKSAIPSVQALPTDKLPLFLAQHQGLTPRGDDVNELFNRIEKLLYLPLPASAWEAELFPARIQAYDLAWLDTIMREGDLNWIGTSKNRIAFYLDGDLPLLSDMLHQTDSDEGVSSDGQPDSNQINPLFPDTAGRYSFASLARLSRKSAAELADLLWHAVWQGEVTNDTFAAVRSGIQNRFTIPDVTPSKGAITGRAHSSSKRSRFQSWKSAVPFAGSWFRLESVNREEGLIEEEELKKERVRQLLDRYGILFRQLLMKELPTFSWASLFRSIRLMELSGEILSGHFFEQVPGPQFISHRAFRQFQQELPENEVFWMNATDPASLCGLQLDFFKTHLPKRLIGNHLVYHGSRLVLVSERQGRSLNFLVEADDPDIQSYLCTLRHLLFRVFQPRKKIPVEIINGKNAAHSKYLDSLRVSFEVMIDPESITLYRQLS